MFDLDTFIGDCAAAVASDQSALAVRDILERAVADPALPDAVGATAGLQVLHHTAELTVLNVVWPPLVTLFPHDHRMWAAIGIYGGQEDNAFYRRNGRTLVPTGGKELRERDVLLLGADAVHAVHNPARTYTGAIHVYGGDFFATARSQWPGDALEEEPFDINAVYRAFAEADAAAAAT